MADVAIPSSGGRPFVAGTYAGDGAASKIISLGFTPSVVMVSYRGQVDRGSSSSAITVPGYTALEYGNAPILDIVAGGFKVYAGPQSSSVFTNRANDTYVYIAFR